jgi:hypothetical protein
MAKGSLRRRSLPLFPLLHQYESARNRDLGNAWQAHALNLLKLDTSTDEQLAQELEQLAIAVLPVNYHPRVFHRVLQLFLAAGFWYAFRDKTTFLSNGAWMPALTVEYQTESERLLLEAAIAYAMSLQTAATTAPLGSVLDICERVAVDKGKAFLRETLEHTLQGRIEELNKKGARANLLGM